jgi:hypothetical protein
MAQNNVKYFLNKNSDFEFGDLRLHYSFGSVSGGQSIINDVSGNDQNFLYSSSPLPGGFDSVSGSGNFDGLTVFEIANNTGNLNFGQDFTFVFVGDGIGTIFNSYSSGYYGSDLVYSGFNFGINDAHKLFFEFKNGFGVETRTLNYGLGDNNSLFISFSANDDLLRLGSYNPVFGTMSSESYYLKQATLLDSRSCFLGGVVNSGNGLFNKNYSGTIDEFLFFENNLDDLDISLINSGFAFGFGASGSGTYVDTIQVTGYDLATGILFSGVTGYQIIETGVLIDDFGNEYSGVSTVPLTGYETGFYNAPLTGIVSIFSGSYQFDDNIEVDLSYLSSFGKSTASVRTIEDSLSEVIEWNFVRNSGFYNLDLAFNNNLKFDRVNLTPISESTKNNLLFVDGRFQPSGSVVVTGSFYEKGVLISGGEFYLSGNKIYSTGKYQNDQFILSDFIYLNQVNVISDFSHVAGTGDFIFNIEDGDMVFFNGRKIRSGSFENEYVVLGATGVISDSFDFFNGESGLFSVLRPSGVEIEKIDRGSGHLAFLDGNTFIDSLLSCYVNYYRVAGNNVGFIEGAGLDRFFGSCNKKTGDISSIYNNNGLFFE